MAKSFEILRNRMSPEARQRSEKLAEKLSREVKLSELRNALGLSQKELATLLKRKQASISRLEGRTDIHVSTLSDFINALGGRLELTATFPDGSFKIKQFEK